MDELQVLREQIELLKKIVDTQDKLIKELQIRTINPFLPHTPVISIPSMWPVETCQHEYPFPWCGITPPPCKKCGLQQLTPSYIITSTTNPIIT